MKTRQLFVLFFTLVLVSSCGGQIPAPKAAHRSVTKYFHKYGKKYKESDFGKHPVARVEIVNVTPVQKGIAQAEAYTYLQDGPVYWVRVTLDKKSFGWKPVAWEKLGVQ